MVMARRRTAGDQLVLVFAAVFLAYYVGFHLHSYYLLPIAPFAALAIGRGVASAFEAQGSAWAWRIAVASILCASMVFGSVVMMAGKKWGRWAPMDFEAKPAVGYERVHLYYDVGLDPTFYSLQSAMDSELSSTPTTMGAYVTMPRAQGVQNLYLSSKVYAPNGQPIPTNTDLTETRIRPVLFGWAVGERWDFSTRVQVFTNAPWTVERVGPLWQFGIASQQAPSVYALYD
jgi:hypothetical protein